MRPEPENQNLKTGTAGRLAVALAIALAASLALALGAANVLLGPLNLDEGWYLLAARNFAAGMRPYRDFFFTQSPLMPAVYGALAPLWSPAGVLGGRVLTTLIGLAASLLASLAASLAAGRGRRLAAGLTAFLLLQCNISHSYFTSIPKTYALASLFVSGGALALVAALRGRSTAWTGFAGGLMLAFAAATRLSLGATLPAAGLALLAMRRRHPTLWLSFGIGGATGLAAALLPGAMADWDAFAFANFFHGGRAGGGLAMSAGSVARLLRNYLPIALLAMATLWRLGAARRDGRKPASPLSGIEATLLAAFAAAFLVHATAPFPYDDYQTPIMPLAAIAVSAAFWAGAGGRRQGPALAAFAFAATLFAMTSPMTESWLVLRKDRFWVDMKPRPDILALRSAAREVAAELPPGAPLLTQDAYLAVETGRPVPPGFEMGPFGYFADLPDAQARRFHVLNRNLALEAIASGEYPVAALSGYAFAMSAPKLERTDAERAAIDAALAGRFTLKRVIPDFGQEHTPLAIWVLER